MKKNAMLKIAAILMVAVLLTTCAISSTFAKYVTSDTTGDAARVAKFGVSVNTNLTDFFNNVAYDSGKVLSDTTSGGSYEIVEDDTIEITDVVAPGTMLSTAVNSVVTGQPEVKVRVSYDADVILTGWNVADSGTTLYCPLVFSVNGTEIYWNNAYSRLEDFETAIETAIENADDALIFDPGTLLGDDDEDTTDANLNLTLGWRWAFASDSTVTGNAGTSANNDAYDTILGNKAATGQPSTVIVKLTTTVTQVD